MGRNTRRATNQPDSNGDEEEAGHPRQRQVSDFFFSNLIRQTSIQLFFSCAEYPTRGFFPFFFFFNIMCSYFFIILFQMNFSAGMFALEKAKND